MVIERKKKGGKGEGGGLVGGDESQKWTNLGRSQKWVFVGRDGSQKWDLWERVGAKPAIVSQLKV